MALGTKSAADIQAIINAALSKKPLLPKGLEQEIAEKQKTLATKKAAKADAAAKAEEAEALQSKTIAKTAAKHGGAITETKLSSKDVSKRLKAEKKAKEAKATKKAAKKGSVAIVKKKRLDALQKLRLKEQRKERRLAKRAKEAEEGIAAGGGGSDDSDDDDEFDSDADGSMFDEDEDDNASSDDETDAERALRQQQLASKVLAKTICGGADKDALAEDPLAATFGGALFGLTAMRDAVDPYATASAAASSSGADATEEGGAAGLLRSLAKQKASEYVPQDTLLKDAHKFFSVLSETERKRNAIARSKIAEMKAINKRGGDKDGFKYVLPTSVKSYARQLAGEGTDIPEDLQSHFLGDGVQDTMKAPSRKKEKKRYHDDFYSFQVAKKWTKNAENFLKKAKNTKNMFISRQQKLRTTKKM